MKKRRNKMETAHRPLIKLAHAKTTRTQFYRDFIEFMTPYHHLAPRERDVFAEIMSMYFRLKESCENPTMVRELLWSPKTTMEICRILGMKKTHFNIVKKRLYDCGALLRRSDEKNGDINPRYLPPNISGSSSLEMRVIFDFSTPEIPETPKYEAVKP